MMTTTYTPAEFAAKFPRARGNDAAVSYVAVNHHPRDFGTIDTARKFGNAVFVGRTNISGTKAVSRFAILPAGE